MGVIELERPNAVQVDEADQALLHEATTLIIEAQSVIGAELERHRLTVDELMKNLSQARADYRSLVGVLAKKYVKQQGRYDFRPELGAFVESK